MQCSWCLKCIPFPVIQPSIHSMLIQTVRNQSRFPPQRFYCMFIVLDSRVFLSGSEVFWVQSPGLWPFPKSGSCLHTSCPQLSYVQEVVLMSSTSSRINQCTIPLTRLILSLIPMNRLFTGACYGPLGTMHWAACVWGSFLRQYL